MKKEEYMCFEAVNLALAALNKRMDGVQNKLDKHIEETTKPQENDIPKMSHCVYGNDDCPICPKPQEKCEHECHCGKNGHALHSINCPVHKKEPIDWDKLEEEFFKAPIHGKEGSRKTFNWLRNKLQTK